MRIEKVDFRLHGEDYRGELVFRDPGDFLYESRGAIHLDELSKWFGGGNLYSVSEFLEHKTVHAEFCEAALDAYHERVAQEAEWEEEQRLEAEKGDADLLTLAKQLSEMRA